MKRAWGALFAVVAAVAATQCVSQSTGSPVGADAGSIDAGISVIDAGTDATTGTVDATVDAGPDQPDATPDALDSALPMESGPDATPDAGVDAGAPDAGEDATADAADAATTNYALSFDDTTQPQYVFVPDATLLDVAGSFTMEAWVNLTGAGHSGTATVIGQPYGPSQVDTTTLWFASGDLYAAVNQGGTGGADTYAWPFAFGTWHHVAWTYDATSQGETLYVDGVAVALQTSTTGLPLYDGHPFLIGSDIDNGDFTYGFDGLIDDVRVFSAVRTAGQIGDDMALVSPVGDPTLVAYYTFDEGTGAVAHDSSGNHLDGTLGGAADAGGAAPTWVLSPLPAVTQPADAGPRFGSDAGLESILTFDPTIHTECVSVPDNALIDVTTALTYEAWIDPIDGAGGGIYSIVGKPVGAGAEDSVAIWFQGGTLFASVNGSSTAGALSYAWAFATNTWHHVAFTYATAGAATFYVDGTSVATAASSAGAPTYDTNPFLIGADINSQAYGYTFLGFIREVRLFNAVRTPAEIATDMSGVSPVGDATLIAYYPLDEGAGTVAHDLSSNHLDGTFGALDGGVASPLWESARGPF